jgi:flagellar hook-length control protein FliK
MSEAPPIIKVARSNTSMKGSKYVISTNISDIYSGDVFIKLLASQFTNTNLVPKETTEINLIDKGIEIILPDDIKSTNEDSAISQIDLVKIEGQLPKTIPKRGEVTSNKLSTPLSTSHTYQKIRVQAAILTSYLQNINAPRSTSIENKVEAALASEGLEGQPRGPKAQTASEVFVETEPKQRTTHDPVELAKKFTVQTNGDETKQAKLTAADSAIPSKPDAILGASNENSRSMPPASAPPKAVTQQPPAPVSVSSLLQSGRLKNIAQATVDAPKQNAPEEPRSTALLGEQTRPKTTAYALVHEMKAATPAVNSMSFPLVARQEVDSRSTDILDLGLQFETSARPAQGTQNTAVPTSIQHFHQDARQIANQLAAQFPKQRDNTTVIRLNPNELGYVRMAMRNIDGVMSMTILAERPETAEIMRRNISDLEQEFQSLGFENLSFEFDDNSPQRDSPAAQDILQDIEKIDHQLSINPENTTYATADGRLNLRL